MAERADTAGSEERCEEIVQAIAARTGGVQTCTTVVRLDYTTREILGHHIVCGAYGRITEAEARQRARALMGSGGGVALTRMNPEDEYIFYRGPDFGHAVAVNARNGLIVFGGTIAWRGQGDIVFPESWEPADALGPGCASGNEAMDGPPMRGFDLRTGTVLPEPEVQAAVDVVWNTALPRGLQQGGSVFDAVVLLYPRTIGLFRPEVAEWVVLVNSGWLE